MFKDPYHITLNITNDCNLDCKYCYIKKENQYMSFDIAKQSIDFAYQQLLNFEDKFKDIKELAEQEKGRILFFGGEPLLNFTLIKQIVDYIEETYPDRFYYAISTNGTLLTEEICNFFKDYDFQVQISFDGIEKIQNYNRPNLNGDSTYDILKEKIQLLLSIIPEAKARGTITKRYIDDWFQCFFEYEQLGFKHCAFDFEYFTNWDDSEQKIKEQLELFKNYYLYYFYINEQPKLRFYTFDYCINGLIKSELFNIVGINEHQFNNHICKNCGYGLEMLSIDPFGNLYPCHEDPSINYKYKKNIIGNLTNGINYDKLNKLQEQINSIENKFLNSRSCMNDCLLYKNKMPCEYCTCPAQALRTKHIQKINCVLKNNSLQIVQDISKELFKVNNQAYEEYLLTFQYYQILKDIISQKDNREFYIDYYTPILNNLKYFM